MKLTDSENNAFKALKYILDKSGVEVTTTTLKENLLYHLDFPRMTSIVDVLNELKVPNMSIKIDSEQLSNIPLPALAFLNVDGGILAPIKTVSNGNIEWLHTSLGLQKESIESFSSKWSGITLLIDPKENSGEFKYRDRRKKEILHNLRVPFLIASLFICTFFLSTVAAKWIPNDIKTMVYLMMGFKIIGVVVSSMLVWYSLDSSNSFLRSVCNLNAKTNCGNILESDAAKLFGILSWAEIGLIYFAGTVLTVFVSVFVNHNTVGLSWVVAMNLLALPYTFYSIGYQAFVARQWCILCLSVQLLLWGEFFVGFAYLPLNQIKLSGEGFREIFVAFLVVIIFWVILKPGIKNTLLIKPLQRAFNRLKWDPVYIQSILDQQRYIPPIFEGMKVGCIGNPDAANTLIMITNPTCEACARIHKDVEILIQNTTDIKCQFILAGFEADLSGEIARTILCLEENIIPEVLHAWFNMPRKKFETLFRDSISDQDADIGSNQLMLHLRWLELAGVTNTPFLFLNGVELSRNYAITEVEKLCMRFQSSRI